MSRNIEHRDRFDMKLDHATALAQTISGEGFESFNDMNNEVKHTVLYLLAETLREARQALENYESEE